MRSSVNMQRPRRRLELPNIIGLAGAVAGLLAGIVMVLFSPILSLLSGIDIWVPPKLIAATVYEPSVLDTPGFALEPVLMGTAIHFGTSIVLGFIFGVVFNRLLHLPTDYGMPLLVGMVYGILIFFLAYALVLPVLNPTLRDFMIAPFLAQNMVFGICVGVLYTWLRPIPYAEDWRHTSRH